MSVVVKGRICGVKEIADVFGVTAATVESWLKNGAPYIKQGGKGKAWQINTAEISKWLRLRELEMNGLTTESGEELRKRKLAAETGKAELELARAAGWLIPVKVLEARLSNMFAQVKVNMRNIPHRLAGDDDELKQRMILEIDLALEHLAQMDLFAEDEVDEPD